MSAGYHKTNENGEQMFEHLFTVWVESVVCDEGIWCYAHIRCLRGEIQRGGLFPPSKTVGVCLELSDCLACFEIQQFRTLIYHAQAGGDWIEMQ